MVKTHTCIECNYSTTKHCNYKKHLLTNKHKTRCKTTPPPISEVIPPNSEVIPPKSEVSKSSTCQYCKKVILKKNRARHLTRCDIKKLHESRHSINDNNNIHK